MVNNSLFDLTSIHQRYWKDFCDVCYSRFGFEQGEVRTYEQKYETFCRCKNYVTSEEGYEEQLLMTKEEDLKRLYDVLLMFYNLRDAVHMIPMLLSLDSMVKTTVESLNADKELIKRVSPRTISIDYEHYCHLFLRKPEYREDVINDIRLKDFEDGWLKDILLRTELPLYNSDEVSRSARKVARALMNHVIISINELIAILPEEGTCPRGTELHAFVYRLFMSYETSLADIKEELEEYPAGLGLEHLKKECEELINEFRQTHLGQHWCSCIEHKNGLQSIAKYFMHHRKQVSEEEEHAFFYTLDKICIISDILNGKADKYWLEVEYPEGWEVDLLNNKLEQRHEAEPSTPNPIVDAIREQTEAINNAAEAMKVIASRPTTQNLVYPQADSTTNVGCDQKQSEFKTFLPAGTSALQMEKKEERKMLE